MDKTEFENLPQNAKDFISLVVRKMRYRKKVRAEVRVELAAHFADELRDCETADDKERKARELIDQFGDPKVLAKLLRRGKKRCRPLWRKIAARSFLTAGLVLLYLIICGAWLSIGSPKISVDYLQWLNDLARAGADESENARPYFDQAAQLLTPMPQDIQDSLNVWPGDLTEQQRDKIERYLADNAKAFDLLGQGVEKPFYWIEYQRSDDLQSPRAGAPLGLFVSQQEVMQSLSRYRQIARAMSLRVSLKAYNGQVESVLEDSLVLCKFAEKMQGKRLLTEQLVGVAIEAMAYNNFYEVLSRNDFPSDVLAKYQSRLERLFEHSPGTIFLDAEKAYSYNIIQHGFTDDGKGNGRPLKEGLQIAISDWKSAIWQFVSFGFPDRKEMTARVDAFYSELEALSQKTPWQIENEEYDSSKWKQVADKSLLLKIVAPALDRMSHITWRLRADRAGLMTTIALLRFKDDKGTYPDSLEKLVTAGYLKTIPMDPFSNKPLVYKTSADGFILYSVGLDFVDDGGVSGISAQGKTNKWADEGDWILCAVGQ